MKNWFRSCTLGAAGAMVCILSSAPALAADGCVGFQGIDHCPVGGATLEATDEGLSVAGIGGEGEDGVASHFPGANHWRMSVEVGSSGGDEEVTYTYVSGGEAISRVVLQQRGDRVRLGAFYTGAAANTNPTFSVMVYDDGEFQGGAGSIRIPGSGSDSDEWDEFWTELIWILLDQEEEFLIASGGGCEFGLFTQGAVHVTLPNGQQLVGDEIRLVEEVAGPGHYPYMNFDSVEVRTTANSLTVTEEVVQGAW